MALKRQLSVVELTLMGVGMILGAGIYALIGVAGAEAGPSLWLAFLTAGVISLLTSLTYAELAAMMPRAGSSYHYVREAFHSPNLAFLSGWLLIAATVIAATTVAWGFANYVSTLGVPLDPFYAAAAVLVLAVWVNLRGVRMTSLVNELATVLEALGLVVVIFVGLSLVGFSPILSAEMPRGLDGFMGAVALAFFAFIGFEVIANEAGEARRPGRDVPLALLLAVLISAALYTLTAISFTSLLSYDQIVSLAESGKGPLATAVGSVGGGTLLLALSIVALFSTGNTILLCITSASRMLYGVATRQALPALFARTREATPVNALLFSGLVAILLLFAGKMEVVANATVLGMLAVFALDNLAVIKLRFEWPGAHRPFRIPLNYGEVPLTALFGFLSCVGLFSYSAALMPEAFAIFLALGLVGFILRKAAGAVG